MALQLAVEETGRQAKLQRLRDDIRRVQAAPRHYVFELHTGVAALDELGLCRLGTVVELCGDASSGRTSLALKALGAATAQRRLGAYVDGPGELYPPAAIPLGVELERLLIVRPHAPGQLVWSAVQLARSGAFACVVLDLTHTGVRLSLADSQKLADATRVGGCLLLLLTTADAPGCGLARVLLSTPTAAATPRLRLVEPAADAPAEAVADQVALEVVRSRQGGFGRRLTIARAELTAGRAAVWRRCAAPTRGARAGPGPATAFERPRKKNLLRDGYGLVGSRPGRDAPLVPLRAAPQSAPPSGQLPVPRSWR